MGRPTHITIPPGVSFADLRMSHDPNTSDVSFEWAPIEAMCDASGLVGLRSRGIRTEKMSPLTWIELGYGSRELAVARIPANHKPWILILDEDAASAGMPSCWYAAQTDDQAAAEQDYRMAGGTVSSSELIAGPA